MAVVLPIDPVSPEPEAVRQAVEALAQGALLVFPTETVYGLAADPRVAGALDRLYDAKGREPGKPVAYLLADAAGLADFGVAPQGVAAKLARGFWPGPLTLVLPAPDGGGTIGFRVPDHPVALAVLRAAGGWLQVTSANRSGEPPARTAAEALAQIGDVVQIVLDGGPVPGGIPSTVVKVTGETFDVLRAGVLSEAELRSIC